MTLEIDTAMPLSEIRTPQSFIGRVIARAIPELDAGQLQIILPNGDVIVRSGNVAGAHAVVLVRRWWTLWRMLRRGEHGFSDGYVLGEWTTPNLEQLLLLGAANERALGQRAQGSWIARLRNRLLHRSRENTRHGSRRNIAAHYDLGNEFYAKWLDGGMNYSSALYHGDETLEAAQLNKLDRISGLLDLSGGERILEIGCGWGALAERLTDRFKVQIKGLTLSAAQLDHCARRMAAQRFEGKLQDYRDETGQYDRVVSVEMLEAVGERFWPTYFAKLRQCLTDTGVAVLQVITIRDDRYESYRRHPDFIQRYIFPGGMLPTPSIVAAEAGAQGFAVIHQESFGESYARTLAEWRRRFLSAWPAIEPLGFDLRFRRMWEYYLTYCEIGFRSGLIDVKFFKLAPR
jgi:cyclopropane-fatty-acyl-phospholipid synthase